MEFPVFLDNLKPILLSDGYVEADSLEAVLPIPIKIKSSYGMILSKMDASIFYIALIATHKEFKELRGILAAIAEYLIEKYGFRHIILFNVIVSEKSSSNEGEQLELMELIKNSEEYFAQPLYEINYAVLLNENRIEYNSSPGHLDGIINKLQEAVDQTSLDMIGETKYDTVMPTKANRPVFDSRLKPIGKNYYFVYFLMVLDLVILLVMKFRPNNNILIFGAMNIELFLKGDYYRLLSAAFLHEGFLHLALNSLGFYIFGVQYEKLFGTLRFLLVFIATALVGNFFGSLFAPGAALIGASGGIYGLIGACFSITLVTKKNLGGLSAYMIFFFALIGAIIGFSDAKISNVAHIAGFVSGIIVGLPLSFNYKKRVLKLA